MLKYLQNPLLMIEVNNTESGRTDRCKNQERQMQEEMKANKRRRRRRRRRSKTRKGRRNKEDRDKVPQNYTTFLINKKYLILMCVFVHLCVRVGLCSNTFVIQQT